MNGVSDQNDIVKLDWTRTTWANEMNCLHMNHAPGAGLII